MNMIGMKIATVVAVEANKAGQTCATASSAAGPAAVPCLRIRTKFSITTIAASSTMPVAKARPASDITLIVRPAMPSTASVTSRQTGTVAAMITVARARRTNSQSRPTASSVPSSRLPPRKDSARLMNTDGSKLFSIRAPTLRSSFSLKDFTSARTALIASSVLLPGSRITCMPIAGLPF